MPFTYTFTKEPLKLGDYDQKYGQAWWGEVNEHLQPVKFNTMSQDDITAEDVIEAEERTEKQTKGDPDKGKEPRPYYQLKKVKVISGSPTQHTDKKTPPPVPQGANPNIGYTDQILERVIRIEAKIDKLEQLTRR